MAKHKTWLIFICLLGSVSLSIEFISSRVHARKPRIPEGKIAVRGQFPYQATLIDTSGVWPTYFCSGAILDSQTVLTAAWCVFDRTEENVSVSYGDTILRPPRNMTRAGKIIVHPYFDKLTKQNDVAIVKLKSSMKFEKFVSPIPLIKRGLSEKEKLVFSGWGSQANNMEKDLLLYTDDFLLDQKCSGYEKTNSDTLCAKSCTLTGCVKDEGSLLVLPKEGLVGIYSHGVDACQAKNPNAFINVFYHRDWILEIKEQPLYDYD